MMNNGKRANFLIADSGQSDDRILIFGRESWTKYLLDSDVWCADGTFRLAPPLLRYLHSGVCDSCKKHGGIHPIFYALLPNKKHGTYVCMFWLLHEKVLRLNPRAISCGFDQEAISAMEKCFPGDIIEGCFSI